MYLPLVVIQFCSMPVKFGPAIYFTRIYTGGLSAGSFFVYPLVCVLNLAASFRCYLALGWTPN